MTAAQPLDYVALCADAALEQRAVWFLGVRDVTALDVLMTAPVLAGVAAQALRDTEHEFRAAGSRVASRHLVLRVARSGGAEVIVRRRWRLARELRGVAVTGHPFARARGTGTQRSQRETSDARAALGYENGDVLYALALRNYRDDDNTDAEQRDTAWRYSFQLLAPDFLLPLSLVDASDDAGDAAVDPGELRAFCLQWQRRVLEAATAQQYEHAASIAQALRYAYERGSTSTDLAALLEARDADADAAPLVHCAAYERLRAEYENRRVRPEYERSRTAGVAWGPVPPKRRFAEHFALAQPVRGEWQGARESRVLDRVAEEANGRDLCACTGGTDGGADVVRSYCVRFAYAHRGRLPAPTVPHLHLLPSRRWLCARVGERGDDPELAVVFGTPSTEPRATGPAEVPRQLIVVTDAAAYAELAEDGDPNDGDDAVMDDAERKTARYVEQHADDERWYRRDENVAYLYVTVDVHPRGARCPEYLFGTRLALPPPLPRVNASAVLRYYRGLADDATRDSVRRLLADRARQLARRMLAVALGDSGTDAERELYVRADQLPALHRDVFQLHALDASIVVVDDDDDGDIDEQAFTSQPRDELATWSTMRLAYAAAATERRRRATMPKRVEQLQPPPLELLEYRKYTGPELVNSGSENDSGAVPEQTQRSTATKESDWLTNAQSSFTLPLRQQQQ
jgi:hypothetical protein